MTPVITNTKVEPDRLNLLLTFGSVVAGLVECRDLAEVRKRFSYPRRDCSGRWVYRRRISYDAAVGDHDGPNAD